MNNYLTKSNVIAVVVSYNPNIKLLYNVKSLVNQVNKCLIIDNGSLNQDAIMILDEIQSRFLNVEVMKLGNNYGIAKALNVGLNYCINNAVPLMLTMDQDTILNADTVSKLLYAMQLYNVSSVGINWDNKGKLDKEVSYLITSGNLIKIDALISIGGYDEKLFIDSVDFDLSLRLLDAGYKLIRVHSAYADHKIGEAVSEINYMGRIFTYMTHDKNRYYYMYRNHKYIIKKFWKNHKIFCIKKSIMSYVEILKIIFFDLDKKEKLFMIRKGINDSKELF